MEPKRAFISYSHSDGDFVQRLVEMLNSSGVPLFFDKWDIKPGDSIVHMVFEKGLANCQLFLIVLSNASVTSKWVREELDVATVRRIEGLTKVVPILKETCEIPTSLRAHRWIDMRSGMDTGVRELEKLAYGVNERPPLGKVPDYIRQLGASVGGLSREASTIGSLLAIQSDIDSDVVPQLSGEQIALLTSLSPQEIDDAVDELETHGLVRTLKWMGTAPYRFGVAEPTYALYIHFSDSLPYDPNDDVRAVVNAVAASSQECDGNRLKALTGLPPGRLNRAVEYIEDYQIAEVIRFMGTAPYRFGSVVATRETREFAKQ